MLEKVDLTRAIPKEEYKTRLPALQASLYDLQLRTSEAAAHARRPDPGAGVVRHGQRAAAGVHPQKHGKHKVRIDARKSRLDPRHTQGRIQDPPAGVAGESLRSAASHVGGGPAERHRL